MLGSSSPAPANPPSAASSPAGRNPPATASQEQATEAPRSTSLSDAATAPPPAARNEPARQVPFQEPAPTAPVLPRPAAKGGLEALKTSLHRRAGTPSFTIPKPESVLGGAAVAALSKHEPPSPSRDPEAKAPGEPPNPSPEAKAPGEPSPSPEGKAKEPGEPSAQEAPHEPAPPLSAYESRVKTAAPGSALGGRASSSKFKGTLVGLQAPGFGGPENPTVPEQPAAKQRSGHHEVVTHDESPRPLRARPASPPRRARDFGATMVGVAPPAFGSAPQPEATDDLSVIAEFPPDEAVPASAAEPAARHPGELDLDFSPEELIEAAFDAEVGTLRRHDPAATESPLGTASPDASGSSAPHAEPSDAGAAPNDSSDLAKLEVSAEAVPTSDASLPPSSGEALTGDDLSLGADEGPSAWLAEQGDERVSTPPITVEESSERPPPGAVALDAVRSEPARKSRGRTWAIAAATVALSAGGAGLLWWQTQPGGRLAHWIGGGSISGRTANPATATRTGPPELSAAPAAEPRAPELRRAPEGVPASKDPASADESLNAAPVQQANPEGVPPAPTGVKATPGRLPAVQAKETPSEPIRALAPAPEPDPSAQAEPSDPPDPSAQAEPSDPPDPSAQAEPSDPPDPDAQTEPLDPDEGSAPAPGLDQVPPSVGADHVSALMSVAIRRAQRCHPGGHAVGTATVFVTFGQDGAVSDAHLVGEPLASAPVASCILGHVRVLSVPPFDDAPFVVSAPIELR